MCRGTTGRKWHPLYTALYTQPFRIACEEAPSTPEDIPQYFDWSALLRKITDRTFGLVADIHEGNGIFDAATKLLFGIKL